ncbi:MAG: hypothetical protein ABFS56_35055 [Pseudomonadota bacterium]
MKHLARVREIKALQSRYRGATLPVTVQADILTPCPTGGDCMQVHDLGLYDKKGTSRLQEIGKHPLNEVLMAASTRFILIPKNGWNMRVSRREKSGN